MQNTTTLDFKRRIMRRVYRLWFFRHVAPLLAVEFMLLAGVAAGVLAHISIRDILLNALASSADVWAFVKFFIANFFIKSIQSRLLVAVYLILAAFFIRDLRSAFGRLWGADELVPFPAGGNRGGALRVS